jgi:predicted dehydrogenase
MRFALLGDHHDGLDMARALVASGRHELAAYTGQPAGAESLARWGLAVKFIRDVEEILADPSIQAVIVASRLADRPAHLRRALQSERHVLCVHPADQTPDIAYEAALIQGDTHCVLLPLLPEALHPAFKRLAELLQTTDGPIGTLQFLQMERGSADAILIDSTAREQKPSFLGWDVLRTLGGEVAEVFAFTAGAESSPDEPFLLTGRFEGQAVFQATFLPGPNGARWHLAVAGPHGRAEVVFPQGWPGPSSLVWQDEAGQVREERWETWNPWPTLVEIFEDAVARSAQPSKRGQSPTWQTAVRCLELDDAARRSIERGRVSTLEYPEATEEVGFKGTMTLVGCGLLWGSLLLLILSAWVSWLQWWWAIVPLLVAFLSLQLLRWLVPRSRAEDRG